MMKPQSGAGEEVFPLLEDDVFQMTEMMYEGILKKIFVQTLEMENYFVLKIILDEEFNQPISSIIKVRPFSTLQ